MPPIDPLRNPVIGPAQHGHNTQRPQPRGAGGIGAHGNTVQVDPSRSLFGKIQDISKAVGQHLVAFAGWISNLCSIAWTCVSNFFLSLLGIEPVPVEQYPEELWSGEVDVVLVLKKINDLNLPGISIEMDPDHPGDEINGFIALSVEDKKRALDALSKADQIRILREIPGPDGELPSNHPDAGPNEGNFLDPINQEIMAFPVKDHCGTRDEQHNHSSDWKTFVEGDHYHEASSIRRYLRNIDTQNAGCPLTRNPWDIPRVIIWRNREYVHPALVDLNGEGINDPAHTPFEGTLPLAPDLTFDAEFQLKIWTWLRGEFHGLN